MKIVLCGSTDFYPAMDEIQHQLETKGHGVIHPRNSAREFDESIALLHADNSHKDDMSSKGRLNKYKLILSHMYAIKNADAILVVNLEKKGRSSYIGGNTFLEMGFAFAFEKKIYVWDVLPEDSTYLDEISGMMPRILNRDFQLINN